MEKNETKEPRLPELTEDDFNRYGGIVNLRSLSGQAFVTAAALAKYASEHKDDCDPDVVKEAGENLMYFAYKGASAQNRGKRIRWRPAETAPDDIFAPVIYCTSNGKLGTLNDTKGSVFGNPEPHSKWEWLAEKYSIRHWVYANEILPPTENV